MSVSINIKRPDDDPIITVGDYRRKRLVYDKAMKAVSDGFATLKELDPFLSTVELLMPDLGKGRDRSWFEYFDKVKAEAGGPSQPKAPKPLTTRDQMRQVLEDYPNGMGGADLHRELSQRGVSTHVNYVYSSLTKMRDAGELIQGSDKSYRLKKYRNVGMLDMKQSPDHEGQG